MKNSKKVDTQPRFYKVHASLKVIPNLNCASRESFLDWPGQIPV